MEKLILGAIFETPFHYGGPYFFNTFTHFMIHLLVGLNRDLRGVICVVKETSVRDVKDSDLGQIFKVLGELQPFKSVEFH